MRVAGGAIVAGALLCACATSALASACDDFNLLRFDPNRLERCIEEIKFNQKVLDMAHTNEVRTLELQLCMVAMELAEIKPSAAELVKDLCSKPSKSKRSAPTKKP
jgi:hypothetical protein